MRFDDFIVTQVAVSFQCSKTLSGLSLSPSSVQIKVSYTSRTWGPAQFKMIAVCTLSSFSEAPEAAKYTSTCPFHRLKFSDTFPEFTSSWGGSLNCPVYAAVISLTKSRGCHHVDLLEWRTRNTTRVENNNMGLFVNRHYESTWFEVKDHGN